MSVATIHVAPIQQPSGQLKASIEMTLMMMLVVAVLAGTGLGAALVFSSINWVAIGMFIAEYAPLLGSLLFGSAPVVFLLCRRGVRVTSSRVAVSPRPASAPVNFFTPLTH